MVWQIYCGTSIFQQNARTVYKVKNTVFTWMKGVIILFLQDWGGWHFLRWFTSSTPGDISFSDLPAAPLVTFPSHISLQHPLWQLLHRSPFIIHGDISFSDLPAAPHVTFPSQISLQHPLWQLFHRSPLHHPWWHFLQWFTCSTPGDISFRDLSATPMVTFPSQISLHHPWYHFLQRFTCSTSGNISFIDLPAAPLGLLSWHYRQCAYLNHFQMYSFLTLPTQMTAQTHTDHKVGSCCKETDKTAKLVQ